MSRYRIDFVVVFLVGLVVAGWVGAGYIVSNPLALAVTLLVAGCYVAGALELQRYQEATATLTRALAELSEAPSRLGGWLEQLHPGLRNVVRLRIEGERVALPGPALTPYLVGLLVLLGMLGTLLGMVTTLRGTGAALDSATDLQAIRASLAAPVKGLGFAFGTSIAGVATSAMLGLLSALCRRERAHAAQLLDTKIATTLRAFSQSQKRDETFRLLQRQADTMPVLVDRLQAMMSAIEQQSLALNERLISNQHAFHGRTEAAYARLVSTVAQSLKDSAAESARAAGAALQPAMEATMAGQAREMASLRETVEHAVQRQLDGLTTGFDASTANVAKLWNEALAGHRSASESLAQDLRVSLEGFSQTFEQRSTALLDGVSARLDATAGQLSSAAESARAAGAALQPAMQATMAAHALEMASLRETVEQAVQRQLDGLSNGFESTTANVAKLWNEALEGHRSVSESLAKDLRTSLEGFTQTVEQRSTVLLDGVSTRLDAAAGQVSQAWTQALTEQERIGEKLAEHNREALTTAASAFEQHSAALLRAVDESHAGLQAELASRDQQRLDAWSASLEAVAATLSQKWDETGERTASRQQAICDTLAQTARDISAQTQAHASGTIAEISRLVEAASEAPRAAAEVVAELRQKLSDSMVRDTAMLEERSRLLATLETLLDAVNHASTEQRTAVDALVATSAGLLERVGMQFNDKVETETRKLGDVAAQVAGSAVEVASLGEAFGMGVRLFGESNDKLMAHLQRIEAALDKSLLRSDEQLAYYVAQAREVIDLSMLSQKQIVEDLQQLAGQRASAGADAA
ncbi:DUF802 domain-containing protein [Paraburkholderia caribensis]|uniref:DUF802 domain-containing protein n=1 Tax=Paraburkholderia caribensis TaxID=75105 RepID=A0A9Q6S9P4_9BURK|nr:DUF802 domain-containing protein [Paraburkholderia caribensis]MCO4878738.1 DUF802 domain-containing protein [Paraburkholderia caribensis]PTB26901.1 DUF802 domain-containing protein [Paraburkholderia caribensis]QLB66704.1 DUF802 domain-containing protein [Paraburkholderia caribensis]